MARYLAYLSLLALAGALPLVAFAGLFGLLTRFVARGRPIPRMISLAIVIFLIGFTWLDMRRITYLEQATRCEETCTVLSTEAEAVSQELERARSAGPPSDARRAEEIKSLEERISLYRIHLARKRLDLEKYRRAANRPWTSDEE